MTAVGAYDMMGARPKVSSHTWLLRNCLYTALALHFAAPIYSLDPKIESFDTAPWRPVRASGRARTGFCTADAPHFGMPQIMSLAARRGMAPGCYGCSLGRWGAARRNVFVWETGPRGSDSGMHYDDWPVRICVTRGRKRLYLVPTVPESLRWVAREAEFPDRFRGEAHWWASTRLCTARGGRAPAWHDTRGMHEIHLRAGECVAIPPRTWHQICSAPWTVGVSSVP